MTDDLLERATRALRRTTTPRPDGMEAMLARVVSQKSRATISGRRRTRALVFALAATFVGLGAWAGATGRLPWTAATELVPAPALVPAGSGAPSSARRLPRGSAEQRLPPALAVLEADAGADEGSGPRVPRALPPGGRAARQRAVENAAPATRSLPSAKQAVLDDVGAVDALYREAHRAHFSKRDFSAALSAWDRYLRAAGSSGRMLVEARYNRAIALTRLGRRSEALEALRPFAAGQYGGYRREEAQRLIDSLDAVR